MNAQQLKNSILQMAVSGKLVPQDPNDEPASVLIERIRKEKEKLIKEGKIKKDKNPSYIFRGADNTPYEKVGKNEPVSIADEVPFEIPESWELVRLRNICNVVSARRVHQADWRTEGVPFYRAREIGKLSEVGFVDNELFISEEQYFEFSKSGVPHPGDLMVTAVGTLGKTYIVKPDDRFYYKDASVLCFENFGGILPEYLKMVMETPLLLNQIKKSSAGTTVGTITIINANAYIIPIPPLREQQRIINRLNEIEPLMLKYESAEDSLDSLNSNFPDQLKKSILQMAVQGKLVSQDPTDEPASVLLKRIRAEKDRLVAEGKIKRNMNESVISKRDNSHYEKLGRNEVCIDTEIPFEIPDSWAWIRLSSILTSTDAGKSPQCKDRPRSHGEWGVIKTTAIQDGLFLENENKVLPIGFDVPTQSKICSGDLLITRAGPRNRTGIMCVVGNQPVNLMLSDKTVRLSYLREYVNPYYVMAALQSPDMQNGMIVSMSGMAESQVNISQEKMKRFLLPLPPLEEQHRIVKQINAILPMVKSL